LEDLANVRGAVDRRRGLGEDPKPFCPVAQLPRSRLDDLLEGRCMLLQGLLLLDELPP
jgi:hypothetical protein